jgi:filamentous hemagglutinin family protein
MTSTRLPFCLTLALLISSWPMAMPGGSQIVPDATVNSLVTPQGNTLQIDGGTTAGTNLFHSFENFSVPTGITAFFNNALRIENIITRITGGKVSTINGLIRANGGANLFLLNPSGILFGPNASLNIGGSFLATTANSIQFADGVDFSAINVAATPLLTVSVPIGLQMGNNPGEIRVQGTGHRLTLPNTFAPLIGAGASSTGLQVLPDKTLALVGGNVSLEGGILSARQGHIELGSAKDGVVNLKPIAQGWRLYYSNLQRFGTLRLSQQALVDASGLGGGEIQLQAAQVSLTEGSLLLMQNQGFQSTGQIAVNATESVQVLGTTPQGTFGSSIHSETLGIGKSADIAITTQRLTAQNGGKISTRTFTPGASGNVSINVAQAVTVAGFSPIVSLTQSTIETNTLGPGQGGALSVSTDQLTLLDGGAVSTFSAGSGSGGEVSINVSGLIDVAGVSPNSRPSSLGSSALRFGNAGNATINTRRLVVREGGVVSSSTLAAGEAGNIVVNASESVEISGIDPIFRNIPSSINSSGLPANPVVQQVLNLPPLTGNSGNAIINTPQLTVTNGGLVTVRNSGTGDAGNLQLNAGNILLDTQGAIAATTASGEGGNIIVQADTLLLRRNSALTTTADGTGNGGNITLDVPIIVGLENSDIAANALQGAGGNIQISTQGIFGPEFRTESTPESDITASSRFGVSGNVSISTPDIQPDATLVELPANLIDPQTQVTSGCDIAANNRFVATGRGGLPSNPTQRLDAEEHPWNDVRDLSVFRRQLNRPVSFLRPRLIEANAWQLNQQGQVEIYVKAPETPDFFEPTCAISQLSD